MAHATDLECVVSEKWLYERNQASLTAHLLWICKLTLVCSGIIIIIIIIIIFFFFFFFLPVVVYITG